METKIIVISTTSAVTQKVKEIIARNNWNIPVYEAVMESAFRIAKENIENGTRVIVSRGGTASFLRSRLNIPVIGIKHSYFDFAYSLQKAFTYSPNVAIVGFTEGFKAAEKFHNLFGDNIKISHLTREDETEKKIKELINQGVEVFIGGLLVASSAKKFGKTAVMTDVDEDSVIEAIEEAFHTLKVQQQLEERYEIINSILNSTSDGIVGIDKNGIITSINDGAKLMIKDSRQGIRADQFPCLKVLKKTLKTGKSVFGHVCDIGKKSIAINCVPILVKNEPVGAVATLQESSKIQYIEHKIRKKMFDRGHIARKTFDDIIGHSEKIVNVKNKAHRFASVDSTVLLLGETGTGKEMFAQSIHNHSPRKNKPFVAINCAAIPSSILESELFGYVKGAFTGARSDGKLGIFELAHTGTIFLDEISETSPEIQARLLRVIQEKEITKMGDDKVIPVDVRIIAASNKELMDEIRHGRFREDLYYRLCVLVLKIPSLRERREDLSEIFIELVKQNCTKYSRVIPKISPGVINILSSLDWPGNVRQLCNVVERMIVISQNDIIDEKLVEEAIDFSGNTELVWHNSNDETLGIDTGETGVQGLIPQIEKKLILKVLRETNGKKSEAAKRLGISQTTLWRKLKLIENISF